MAELVLGRLKFHWKGNWAPSTAFIKDDVVKYGPTVWVCTANHTSGADFDFTKFEQMVNGIDYVGIWTAGKYEVNDIVSYGGAIYICTVDHDTGDSTDTKPTNSDYWDKLVGGLEWEGTYSDVKDYQTGDIVQYGGYTYVALQDTNGNDPTDTLYWNILNKGYTFTGEWSAPATYNPGDLVTSGGKIYAAISSNIGDVPPSSNWNLFASGSEFLGDWDIATGYVPGQIVRYGGNQYINILNSLGFRPSDPTYFKLYSEGFNYRGDYAASTTYNPGDVVRYGARQYLCKTDFVFSSTEVLPTDTNYWELLGRGLAWQGNWSSASVFYRLDDVVEYSGSSYVCIQAHTSAPASTPDVSTPLWQSIAQGDANAVLTTTGDMIFRNAVGTTTRLPVGPDGSYLIVNNGVPTWGNQSPQRDYYVSLEGDDSNDGKTPVSAWKTIRHACDQTYNLGQCRINITSGTYAEQCPIKIGRSVVLEGNGLGAVTIAPNTLNDNGYGAGISDDGSTPNANSEVFHVNNGSRLRNVVFRNFSTGSVCVSLDPGTGPDDTSVWITSQSPYVQNCTSFTPEGTGMLIDGALHNGGYKSAVANDWTQINSDGVGIHVKSDARVELVSCFTYYCDIGYLAESGAKIRALVGNNSYGEYGAVARGFSQAETPLTGNLQLSDDTVNSISLYGDDVHIFTSYRDLAGNIFSVGHTNPTGTDANSSWSNTSSYPFITKQTSSGNLDWAYTYESSFGAIHSVVELDSAYYAGGVIYDGGQNKGFILKISGSGEIQWQKIVGDTDEITDITTDGSTYLYAVGNHTSKGVSVLRITGGGNTDWTKTLDYNDSSINTITASSIVFAGTPTTSTDTYALAGDATAESNLYIALRDSTASESFIARVDNSGNLVTAYNYGDIFINKLHFDTGNGDGIYLMAAGYIDPADAANKTPYIMRISVDGTVQWQQTLDDGTLDGEYKNVYALGNDVYAVGYMNDTDSTQTFNRGLITRFASNGVVDWTQALTDDAQNIWFNSVTIDGVNVIIAGNRLNQGLLTSIQRDLTFGIGTVTENNWTLGGTGITYSSATVATKNIQNIFIEGTTIGLTNSNLTLNESPGKTRTINATRNGFAGIGRGVTFTISNLSRTIKEGSVLQIDGDNETYFVISVAGFDGANASIGIDPPIPSNKTPNDNTPVVFREAFSQIRMTGHDFLDIGTGGFADTNYPVIIDADYIQTPNQEREVDESNGGRVFYVTTDQDGNFRVGNYFKVEQATGRATLSSEEFDLSGLNELQLGSITAGRQGATINEFSTDGTMGDNADTAVPTERAIVTYVGTQLNNFRSTLRDWTIINNDTAASTGDQLFVDTTSIAVTVTLPSSPTTGDIVRFNDIASNFNTNNLIINPGSEKLVGAVENMVVNTVDASFALVYSNATYGWKLLEI